MTAQTARLAVAPSPARARPALRLVPGCGPRPLEARERHAVMLGRADAYRMGWDASLSRASLRARLAALLTRATGIRGVTPFADPRLEQFRLFAAMMRRGDRRADALAAELTAQGVSPAALREAIGLALG